MRFWILPQWGLHLGLPGRASRITGKESISFLIAYIIKGKEMKKRDESRAEARF
jgi:hypothetical protein